MDHIREADERQAAIYRRMTPRERLQLGLRMNAQMRRLMDAGLRAAYPTWTAAQRQRVVAERILYARTG